MKKSDGVKYNITPIKEQSKPIILEQHLKFEVYPKDLGKHNWENAKKVCEDLGDNWRLPTREELHLIWLNKDNIGFFVDNDYWSSVEDGDNFAWELLFSFGKQISSIKSFKYNVCAVRDLSI